MASIDGRLALITSTVSGIEEEIAVLDAKHGLRHDVLALVPAAKRDTPAYRRAERRASGALINLIHIIYRNKPYDGQHKDHEFSATSRRQHWASGLDDMHRTLAHPQWLTAPHDRATVCDTRCAPRRPQMMPWNAPRSVSGNVRTIAEFEWPKGRLGACPTALRMPSGKDDFHHGCGRSPLLMQAWSASPSTAAARHRFPEAERPEGGAPTRATVHTPP